jgi:hypothetical protein
MMAAVHKMADGQGELGLGLCWGRRSAALAAAMWAKRLIMLLSRWVDAQDGWGPPGKGAGPMRAFGICSVLVTASVVLLVTSSCAAPAATSTARAPSATSAPAGTAAPGGTGYSARGTLWAVAATSAANAWAVGDLGQQGTPLIVHWNGTKWSRVLAGAPADTELRAVAASSPGNAWALGETYPPAGSLRQMPVILHWNGRAWRQVPSPASSGAFLNSVSVTSAANAWVVGSYFASANRSVGSTRPIALHWNGSAWRRAPLPVPTGAAAELTGVSATSASDAWAVGAFFSKQGNPGAGFVLHWDGSSWTQVPSAPASAGEPIAVAATATDYAWLADSATGSEFAWPGGRVAGLWNGHDWTTVPIPLVQTHNEGRGGDVKALAVAGHDAWMAGDYCTTPTTCGNGPLLPFLLRWTGGAWQFTPPPANDVNIFGLAVLSSTSAWAVGYTHAQTTLILHWNGTTWS